MGQAVMLGRMGGGRFVRRMTFSAFNPIDMVTGDWTTMGAPISRSQARCSGGAVWLWDAAWWRRYELLPDAVLGSNPYLSRAGTRRRSQCESRVVCSSAVMCTSFTPRRRNIRFRGRLATGTYPSAWRFADLNGDGKDDLVVMSFPSLRVFRVICRAREESRTAGGGEPGRLPLW